MNDYELAWIPTAQTLLRVMIHEKHDGRDSLAAAYWRHVHFHFKLFDLQGGPARKFGCWPALYSRRTTLDILRGALDDCDQA